VLGNLGKPVTLETLRLTKFLRHVFRNRELTIFRGLGPAKPRIRECTKFRDRDSGKTWSREHAEAQNLKLAMARTNEEAKADSGICRGPTSGVAREDIHEPTKKRRPIRESVGDPVRESRVKTFTNWRRSKVKVVVPKSPGFECELVADL
jgi:hypothetical protein